MSYGGTLRDHSRQLQTALREAAELMHWELACWRMFGVAFELVGDELLIYAPARVAPWPDFKGRPIHEGDTIRHPDGETGIVLYYDNHLDFSDRWRVDYGHGPVSRLILQIGHKGQAEVSAPFPARDHPRAPV